MNLIFGKKSFLAKSYLSKSKKINYSLEKKDLEIFFNLDKKKFIENYLNNYKIKFIFIFIGKNYKKVKDNNFVNNSINYEIPIRILKKLINFKLGYKLNFIFFGSQLEYQVNNFDNISDYNYAKAKKKLSKFLYKNYKVLQFNFLKLDLPLLYFNPNDKKTFLFYLVKSVQDKKKFKIKYPNYQFYFLNVSDLVNFLLYLETNKKIFNNYKNRSLPVPSDGPYKLIDIAKSLKANLISNFIDTKTNKKRLKFRPAKIQKFAVSNIFKNIKNFYV